MTCLKTFRGSGVQFSAHSNGKVNIQHGGLTDELNPFNKSSEAGLGLKADPAFSITVW